MTSYLGSVPVGQWPRANFGVKVHGVRKDPFSLISSKLSFNAERATEEIVKPLYFRILAEESKLESQLSSLEARNNVIHIQNEGLCNKVASLRAAVDSLEQGLKAAQSTTPTPGSTANEVMGLIRHDGCAVPGARGDKEQADAVPYNRQFDRPNLIMIRGKSLMEIPSPNAQRRTARSPNTDTVKRPQHTSLLSPAPQFMTAQQNRSAIYPKALMSLKTKQLKLFYLLRSFGLPWYSYDSIPSRISRPSGPSTKQRISVQQRTSGSSNVPNHPAVRVNQECNHEDGQVACHVGNRIRQIVTNSETQLAQERDQE